MARHKTNTVDFFYHPVKNGTRMFIMEQNFGDKGYVSYYKLLELLGAAEGHFLDFTQDKHRLYFAAAIRADLELTNKIISMLAEIGSIDKQLWEEKQIIWCQEFVDKISDVYSKRGRKTPVKPYFCDRNDTSDVLIADINIQRKGKERKAQESKEKESKENEIIENINSEDSINPRNGIVMYNSDQLIDEVINSKWLEGIGIHFRINLESIKIKFKEFALEQKHLENLGRALGEIKKHFFNTIKKNSNESNKKHAGVSFKPGGPGQL